MKKIPSFWITGTAVALAGVVVARVIAPELDGNAAAGGNVAFVVKTLGHILAFVGIFLVARGIGKHSNKDNEE